MADRSTLATLEATLDLYFGQKAPALPSNIKELLVKLAPWVTLVMLIFMLPFVLIAFGLGALVAPFAFLLGPAYGFSYGMSYTLNMIIVAIALMFEALSIPGLFSRSAQGWRYAYYAMLVSVVGNLIAFNIGGAIVGAVLGFYILFQIKSYYGTSKTNMAQTTVS